jgi:hypothetical protein
MQRIQERKVKITFPNVLQGRDKAPFRIKISRIRVAEDFLETEEDLMEAL